jgi:ATP-binding cassette, subfamily C (CFTR/MRP), member 1
MVRGCLVSVIYRKTTDVSIVALDDAVAVTLMSIDVERIVSGLAMMHDIWSTLLQIAIASWLLQTELGIAFIVPIIIFLCK